MKIVVIGGTGLIGSKVVSLLAEHGHEAVAASPNTGVNTLTGEGVAEALNGADVVVDVSNSPSFADADVLDFFTRSTGILLDAEREAGVDHHVALSIVGADRLPGSGYLRAKVAQEALITASGQPYTILRATQFYEFLPRIADSATVDGTVHLPVGLMQPIAAAEVSAAVAKAAVAEALNGVAEIGGPERLPMSEYVERALRATGDERTVVGDPAAQYFGTLLEGDELTTTHPDATISATTYEAWSAAQPAAAK
ncbi:SDR family oxidoreductase [Agromyces seonyuensis]|uniref:NAD(P)H-binding protein n=1 Tax=Agromyces seonyuensis TaxID=2662446 RepID=A0A6I4P1V8_9MICO|nr:SDR family oxidoreductase [Agromyces seonyuensis]MWB98725.1 NAD(P)H-binding protein [Agromyces seonyuensis]